MECLGPSTEPNPVVDKGRSVEDILASLTSGFSVTGVNIYDDDSQKFGSGILTPTRQAKAVSSEVSAPASDEAAGFPAVQDQQIQGEEPVPKHGSSEDVVEKDDSEVASVELGCERDGNQRGVWITPMSQFVGCDIESPPGLGSASTIDSSGGKKRTLRFEDDWSNKGQSGIVDPLKSLKPPLSIMTVRSGTEQRQLSTMGAPEWQEIEITVDSGAYDTVMPAATCGHISIVSTPESRGGLEYEVANGECIPNLGERRCLMMTENSHTMKRITFQCADVHKPLLSVSRVSDLGYECTLNEKGGRLTDMVTADIVPIHRKGNLYVIRAWIKADDQGFGRQG